MEFYTYDLANFPKNGLIEKKERINPTNADGELIAKYEQYIRGGYIEAANQLLLDNPRLEKMQVDSSDPMRLQEEIRNTQIMTLLEKQSIYLQDKMPEVYKLFDVWIGGDTI